MADPRLETDFLRWQQPALGEAAGADWQEEVLPTTKQGFGQNGPKRPKRLFFGHR
jgi:hypothetical protein